MRAADYPVITTLTGNEYVFLSKTNTSDAANNITPDDLGTFIIDFFDVVLNADNLGTGIGVFLSQAGNTLQFKGVAAASARVLVTNDSVNNNVNLDVAESALNLANMGGTLGITHGGTGALTASAALTNLGALPLAGGTMTGFLTLNADPTASLEAATKQYVDDAIKIYNGTSVVANPIIWNGTATTTTGIATFNPTVDGTPTGTAIFTNIYAVQAIAANNTTTEINYMFASLKQIVAGNKTITINVGSGTNIPAGGGDSIITAPDGTPVYLTIFGN